MQVILYQHSHTSFSTSTSDIHTRSSMQLKLLHLSHPWFYSYPSGIRVLHTVPLLQPSEATIWKLDSWCKGLSEITQLFREISLLWTLHTHSLFNDGVCVADNRGSVVHCHVLWRGERKEGAKMACTLALLQYMPGPTMRFTTCHTKRGVGDIETLLVPRYGTCIHYV